MVSGTIIAISKIIYEYRGIYSFEPDFFIDCLNCLASCELQGVPKNAIVVF